MHGPLDNDDIAVASHYRPGFASLRMAAVTDRRRSRDGELRWGAMVQNESGPCFEAGADYMSVGQRGLEPRTSGLRVRCSTN